MIIGMYIKHIKAYKGINYVPLGHRYNFSAYIGENGAGKSSVLEALDSFLNNKSYNINKGALNDGIYTVGNEPYFAPIFLIKKAEITRYKKEFDRLSYFFWNVGKEDLTSGARGSLKEFFSLRNDLVADGIGSETHYLLVFGETNLTAGHKLYFASFQNEKPFLKTMLESDDYSIEKKSKITLRADLLKKLEKAEWKKVFQYLKSLYAYVYIPVEIDVEKFTKIETDEMQKIFDRELIGEIQTAISGINLNKTNGVNRKLDSFIEEIEEILDHKYHYSTGTARNNTVTESDLVNKIIEVYFQKRLLYKKGDGITKKVSELSAGEKRQALVNLVYAFLKRKSSRERMIIVGIDEPENSLHTSLCYDQFEKLREVSIHNQILITTHWYGFLPIVSEGYSHFLSQESEKIIFETYDLFDYRSKIKKDIEESRNRIPQDFSLKSTYDLVQSIFYSIRNASPYNWLICEGVSEKIYFEHFFEEEIKSCKLRILPMGGAPNVVRLHRYLEVPIKDENNKKGKGRIYCLIDTDQNRCEEISNGCDNLRIRRLSNHGSSSGTKLLTLNHSDTHPTDIEQSLNPGIFQQAIKEIAGDEKYHIEKIEDATGNTDFHLNLKSFEIKDFFKIDEGKNKVLFSKKYIEISKEKSIPFPPWVLEIKTFFNKS